MSQKKNAEKVYLPFTLCLIGVMTVILTYNISLGEYTDFNVHAKTAEEFLAGGPGYGYPALYITYGIVRRLTGISSLWAMAYTQTFYTLLCAIAVYIISCLAIPSLSKLSKCLVTLFMTFCGPIYIGGVHYYLGVGSFNTWHNPTNTCVKFLALLVFFLFSYVYQNIANGSIKLGNKTLSTGKALLLLSFLLTVSPFFKPSFFQVFGPTVFLIVVFDFLRKKISFTNSLRLAAVLFPALCIIVFQAFNLFWGGDFSSARGITIAPFKVWSYWSVLPIPVSIALSVAFPVFAGIFCNVKGKRDYTLIYAFIFYFVSVLEYSLLSETADWESGNFGWGKCLAIGILFLSSVFHFIRYLENNQGENNSRKTEIVSFTGFSLLSLHFIWGSWYYWKLLFSGSLGCF